MKKVLILIISIGLVFGLVGIGTQAYFSDVKTSGVSIFTSGVWDNPKAITAFSFQGLTPAVIFSFQGLTPVVIGVVNEGAHTVALTVPFGTDVTTLVPTIAITGASVDPASGVAQDFTSPVTYTVTTAGPSTQAYVVTVTIAAQLSSAKDITAFSFQGLTPAVAGTITGTNIALTVPFGTDITKLVATFANSADSTVKVGSIAQVSGITANDFTSPVTYTVTAAGPSTQAYVVTVTIAAVTPSTVATVTSATYTVGADTITNVPFGTSKTAFLAALTKGQADQTWNDTGIANPVVSTNTLVVTAQDGLTTIAYTVTVNTAPDTTAPVITAPADQTFEATGPETTPTLVEATATDIVDPSPVITYTPHSFPVGDTTFTWTATDVSGNASTTTSKVTITDTTAPVITLNGVTPDIEVVGSYIELGAIATDAVDGSFAATPSGSVDKNTVGSYTITYTATDAAGNKATEVTRTVIVN